MSAALQLPLVWAARAALARSRDGQVGPVEAGPFESTVHHLQKRLPVAVDEDLFDDERAAEDGTIAAPLVSYAFYRRHTEKLLQRYLQASFLIGRSPTLLAESVDQGWSSYRRVRTFEDALIFVLDIEKCIKKLNKLDLEIISRVVVQNNTQKEAAALIGISLRILHVRLPEALDRLTERLVKADLLTLPAD